VHADCVPHQVAKNRCLYLLGSADPGAPRSLGVLLALAFLFVGMLNVPLLLPHTVDALSHLMSNDDEVLAFLRRPIAALCQLVGGARHGASLKAC
jgi:hypothetical protein